MTEVKTINSPAFRLLPEERDKWIMNFVTFLVPIGMIYSGYVVAQVNLDGFQTTDFVPNQFTAGAIVLYVSNTIYDFCRKWVPRSEVVVEK